MVLPSGCQTRLSVKLMKDSHESTNSKLMSSQTPYAPPTADSTLAQPSQGQRTNRLWLGFFVAPPVVPIILASVIFFGGAYVIDPNDTGTPIGIIIFPILLLTAGIAFSYFLSLVIGMPIAFWLNRRNRLNGYSIHLVAIGLSLLFGMVSACIAMVASVSSEDLDIGVLNVLAAIGISSLTFGILVIPTATLFWLVSCKLGKSKPQLTGPDS